MITLFSTRDAMLQGKDGIVLSSMMKLSKGWPKTLMGAKLMLEHFWGEPQEEFKVCMTLSCIPSMHSKTSSKIMMMTDRPNKTMPFVQHWGRFVWSTSVIISVLIIVFDIFDCLYLILYILDYCFVLSYVCFLLCSFCSVLESMLLLFFKLLVPLLCFA